MLLLGQPDINCSSYPVADLQLLYLGNDMETELRVMTLTFILHSVRIFLLPSRLLSALYALLRTSPHTQPRLHSCSWVTDTNYRSTEMKRPPGVAIASYPSPHPPLDREPVFMIDLLLVLVLLPVQRNDDDWQISPPPDRGIKLGDCLPSRAVGGLRRREPIAL